MTQMILVAEDSVTMRTVAEMAFHGSPYRVVTVESGEQALHAAYEHRPAVLVLDYQLPDRSGLDLCRAIQGDPSLRDIPVLILGGRYHAFSEEEALAAGASAVMTKPYTTDAFVEQVTQLARSGAAPRAQAPPQRMAPPPMRAPIAPPAAPAAAPAAPRPSRFGAPPMGASNAQSTSGSMPGLGATSESRPRFGGAPQPPAAPVAPPAAPARPRFGGAPAPTPPAPPAPPAQPMPPAPRASLGGTPSGGMPSPMRRPPAPGGSDPGARLPQPPMRPGMPRGPLGPTSGSLSGGSLSGAPSGDDSISHDDKTPRPAPLPQAPSVTASDVFTPAPPASAHSAPTPVPPSIAAAMPAYAQAAPAPVAPVAAVAAAPSPEQLAQAVRASIAPEDLAAAIRAAFSSEEIERIAREEIQKVVREQMLVAVKTVLGDLFQERMLPRLLKYGEDRINVAIQGNEFQHLVQDAVANELAKLS